MLLDYIEIIKLHAPNLPSTIFSSVPLTCVVDLHLVPTASRCWDVLRYLHPYIPNV